MNEVFVRTNHKNAKHRKPNLDHIYEIFGRYSHESLSVVRTSIVDFVTCDPKSFKEKLVIVFTMLNLDLDSWLIRTKNPKTPTDEASLYGLCQLYSHHALAYTTGSVWLTLELHGNYSVGKIKCHCDVHLVFLEGGILGQLHKKPMIPRLMSTPVKGIEPCIVVIDDITSDTVQTGQVMSIVNNTQAQTLQ